MVPVALGRRLRRKARAGDSGSKIATTGTIAAIATVTATATPCQPYCTASSASSGRKASCPAAFAALSSPIARPLLAANQRFAIAAATPTAPPPAPIPTMKPQVMKSCPGAVIKSDRPVPAANSPIHARIVRFRPITWTRPVRSGPVSKQDDVDRYGAGDRAEAPSEGVLQRKDHHSGRRAHAAPSEHGAEHRPRRSARARKRIPQLPPTSCGMIAV